jgi:hypothetical protein
VTILEVYLGHSKLGVEFYLPNATVLANGVLVTSREELDQFWVELLEQEEAILAFNDDRPQETTR